MIATLYFIICIIILLPYDRCYGGKIYFIWFIRNIWGKLPSICKSLLILCNSYQSKAEASKWWSCKLYTLMPVLCFDYRRGKKFRYNLRIMMRMGSREYTLTQSWHLYLWIECKWFGKLHILKKMNYPSMNDPSF